jgi:hypothetical protein
MEDFIVFFINKNGLNDFVVITASSLKDALCAARLFSKASKCEILGVCRDCFRSFKLDQYE